MKKGRIVLHILLSLSIIITITCFVISAFESRNYMPEKEANQEYGKAFNLDLENVLTYVGQAAQFKDKYGADDKTIDIAGKTVGELKAQYYNGIGHDYSYALRQIYLSDNAKAKDNSYYDEAYQNETNDGYVYDDNDVEYDDDDAEYDDDDDNFYYGDYRKIVSKYKFDDYNEFKTTQEKLKYLEDFYYNYSYVISNKEIADSHNNNFDYFISYTDTDGKVIQYSSRNGDKVATDANYIYFVYDKSNSDVHLNKMDEYNIDLNEIVSKCDSFTDYKDFYAIAGVNTNYKYNDDFSYYAKEVTTNEKSLLKYNFCICTFIISGIICLILFAALIGLTGRSEGKDKYELYSIDKLWWDVAFIIEVIIYVFIAALTYMVLSVNNDFPSETSNSERVMIGFIGYVLCENIVIFLLSVVRRIKSKCFWKTCLISVIWCKIVHYIKALTHKKKIAVAVCVLFGLVFFNWLLLKLSEPLWIIASFVEVSILVYLMVKFFGEYDKIIQGTEKIAQGNLNYKLHGVSDFELNKKMAEEVNNIGDGLSKAVDESVKNERMKTDLITNVSHDIKTPLTSIINYVNLLKSEKIEGENVNKYIGIIDEKAQRLKSLTDDLVEASKLSSGAVKLEFEKINIVELIKQSAGEYEEKFEEKNLETVLSLPDKPVFVYADGRKIWRLLENLYGNIYKYALNGTRVYADMAVNDGKVIVSIKNISENLMNFNSNELTERFIRGDVSRSTEGSGLGLSIAESIVQKHGGNFKITIDGDLFKVVFALDEMK